MIWPIQQFINRTESQELFAEYQQLTFWQHSLKSFGCVQPINRLVVFVSSEDIEGTPSHWDTKQEGLLSQKIIIV